MMGSAALAMVYVASGRFDAYVEAGIRLWDIAAGGLIFECAQVSFGIARFPASTPTRSKLTTGCSGGNSLVCFPTRVRRSSLKGRVASFSMEIVKSRPRGERRTSSRPLSTTLIRLLTSAATKQSRQKP